MANKTKGCTMCAEILNGIKVRMSRPKINHVKVTKYKIKKGGYKWI